MTMIYFCILGLIFVLEPVLSFSPRWKLTFPSIKSEVTCTRKGRLNRSTSNLYGNLNEEDAYHRNLSSVSSRRAALASCTNKLLLGTSSLLVASKSCDAAVGTLPEYEDSNAIVQGITVDVADSTQEASMISFLQEGFNFKVLRQRKIGSITDTWMGFGPEQLSIPNNFEIPVSSFGEYGGHASIHIRYDSKTSEVFYKKGENAPGDNIAYLQVAVPEYRISRMVQNGGNILDAYGIVNVISPSGLPIRGIVGISPDPIMFLAINCLDISQSKAFYERLGFVERDYPYSRPSKGTGQFEPPQPKKSVYLAPSQNSMGILLLPTERKKKTIKPNPAFRSMNIVFTPSDQDNSSDNQVMQVADPSFSPILFQPSASFEKEELSTRVQASI